MTLIEKNNIIAGKYKDDTVWKNKENLRTCTSDEFMQFMDLLNINEKYTSILKRTEVSDEFYNSAPLFTECIPNEIKRDVFYAAKLQYMYEGIPSELVYLIVKALKKYDTSNTMITSVKWQQRMLLKNYLPEGHTIKEVIENILGHSINLITEFNRKVAADNNVYEIYVENTDRIVVVPEDIANMVNSLEDLQNVQYVRDVGVCVYDVPLRTMNGRLGVCFDEYDLRESR